MVFWALKKSGKYPTSSLYRTMTSGGVRDSQMMTTEMQYSFKGQNLYLDGSSW